MYYCGRNLAGQYEWVPWGTGSTGGGNTGSSGEPTVLTGNPLKVDFTNSLTGYEVDTANGWVDGTTFRSFAGTSVNAGEFNFEGGTFDASAVPNPLTEAQYRSVVYAASDASHSGALTITLPQRTGQQYVRLHFMNVGNVEAFSIVANGTTIKSSYIAGDVTTPTPGKASVVPFNVNASGGKVIIVLTPLTVGTAAFVSAVQCYQ
jgi:hypothetical protein